MTTPIESGPTSGAVLALRGVARSFGAVRALRGVDLDVAPGEVHAVVGENGAGKSTLLKIVAGILSPDTGEVVVHGAPLPPGDRRASAAAGVGVVHQHFSLVPTLTGAENYCLGQPGGGALVDRRAAAATLREWAERTGLDVDPDTVVDDLSVGARQRLEILTALGWGAEVLLLDEPTAVLSPLDADGLLAVVRQLAADGLAVVLVTHKLREVERHADRVTVLRDGAVVGRHAAADVDRDRLVAEMVGEHRDDTALYLGERHRSTRGDLVARVRDLGGGRLRELDLDLYAGEVVGVAGVVGSGQAELVGALCGLVREERGTVEVLVDGQPVSIDGDPRRAAAAGVALIPEDRERDALAPHLPVWVNVVAKRTDEIGGWGGLRRDVVARLTERALQRLGVRPADPALTPANLSGGNQQRLVIGRELDRRPHLVVAAEPTRGLDPASALAVIDALRSTAAAGAAVVVAASDLDELTVVADRLVVLCDGRVTLDAGIDEADRAAVGRAMAGVE